MLNSDLNTVLHDIILCIITHHHDYKQNDNDSNLPCSETILYANLGLIFWMQCHWRQRENQSSNFSNGATSPSILSWQCCKSPNAFLDWTSKHQNSSIWHRVRKHIPWQHFSIHWKMFSAIVTHNHSHTWTPISKCVRNRMQRKCMREIRAEVRAWRTTRSASTSART